MEEGREEELTEALETAQTAGVAKPVGDATADASDQDRRWHAATVALSLCIVPGCGHLYVGQVVRGFLWSCLFLGAVLPLGFFMFFTWAFSQGALLWVLLGVAALLVLVGLGPALHALRSPAPTDSRSRSRVVVAAYACVVALSAAVESGWFLAGHLETVRVTSLFLEPLAFQDEDATILISDFTRPVHEEVILFALSPERRLPAPNRERCLGRVLAKPGDSVSLKSDRIFVNGIHLDLRRTDQRRMLEKAGRKERRRRFLDQLFTREMDLSAVRVEGAPLEGEDWSVVLPSSSYLVLPDVDSWASDLTKDGVAKPSAEDEKEKSPHPTPTAWLIDRPQVLGRMIPWHLHF